MSSQNKCPFDTTVLAVNKSKAQQLLKQTTMPKKDKEEKECEWFRDLVC